MTMTTSQKDLLASHGVDAPEKLPTPLAKVEFANRKWDVDPVATPDQKAPVAQYSTPALDEEKIKNFDASHRVFLANLLPDLQKGRRAQMSGIALSAQDRADFDYARQQLEAVLIT